MLRTLVAPPQSGSLRESVFKAVLRRQEDIQHDQLRAIAQLLIDKTKGIDAFNEYMKSAFPYLEQLKAKDKADMVKQLQEWVGRGPLLASVQKGHGEIKSRMRAPARVAGRPHPNLYSRLKK